MIDLPEKDLILVRKILKYHVPNCEVRAFGSRITGQAKKFSDLDLVLIGQDKLDWRVIENLKEAFSISELPYMVDICDWHAISDSFRDVIAKQYEVIQLKQVNRDTD